MRCIEITIARLIKTNIQMINRNMRCIEMLEFLTTVKKADR